jgi:hypothetical protein
MTNRKAHHLPSFQPVRFSCGPTESVGALSLRGTNGSCSYYRTVAIEVHPRSNLEFTVREAVAVPREVS